MARAKPFRLIVFASALALAESTQEIDAEIIKNLGFYRALAVLETPPTPTAAPTIPPAKTKPESADKKVNTHEKK